MSSTCPARVGNTAFFKGLFGGKDMTLFHLKRLDDSDGAQTLDDIKHDRLTPGTAGIPERVPARV